MEETDTILYNTLSPLSLTATAADDHPTPPPPPSSDDSEPYLVLRNQISLSSIQPASPETAAVDYFSLDVDDDEDGFEEEPNDASFKTPTTVKEPERTLEGNWFRANCRFKSPMLQLHKEIIDFCDFLSPTPEEQESRDAAIERVFDVIKYIWPNCKPEIFGSFETGLYLPSSDIDVVILGSDMKSPQIGLHALSRALSQKGVAKKIQVIARARVPIVKFVEKKSGIAFDISFDVHNGPKAAEFIKDAVSKWPPLRPLCLILKVFLQQRELNEVYTGGIGSYALLAMLIAMLRSQRDCHTSLEHNLGVLLVNFFDIYGRKLNTSDVGVSCSGEGTFFLKSSKGFSINGKSSLISIQDPELFWRIYPPEEKKSYIDETAGETPENDIGKSSFNYFQVRSAFAMAFTTLTNTKIILGLSPNRSILGTIIRPDAVLLERKGGVNGEVTFNNLLPGAGDPVQQQYGDQQEMYCNWQLNDEEEEPLPRGNAVTVESTGHSKSSKKRKAAKEKKLAKKENGDVEVDNENSTKKKKRAKKPRWRHSRNGGDSCEYGHYRGSSTWSRG